VRERSRPDECVVARTSGNAERVEPLEELRRGGRGEKPGFREVGCEQPSDRRARPPGGRGTAREYREALERGVSG
jgi:hypothetical protein